MSGLHQRNNRKQPVTFPVSRSNGRNRQEDYTNVELDSLAMMGGMIFFLVSVSLMTINTIALMDEESAEGCSNDVWFLKMFLLLSILMFVTSGLSTLLTLDIRMPEIQQYRGYPLLAFIIILLVFHVSAWFVVLSHTLNTESCKTAASVLNGNVLCGFVICGIPLFIIVYLAMSGGLRPLLTSKPPDYIQLSQIARPTHVRGI